jgi:DNA-binding MarR family transcriptional regulator
VDEQTRRLGARWQSEPETQQLRKLQTAMTDAESAMARTMGMGHSDIAAMTHLASARQPVGPSWLSARLGLTPAAATELVDRLERVGHVARERDNADRRRVNLIPTESAMNEVHALLRPLLDKMDAVAGGFDVHERAAIRRYITEVIAIYEDFAADPQDL